MNNFWTVVSFTLKNKFRGKAFVITTLIIACIMTIAINLPYIFSQFNNGDKVTSIGYIQSEQAEGSATGDQLKAYFELQEKPGVKLVPYADKGSEADNEKQLKQAITDKDIKGYLTFGQMTDSGFPEMTYKSEKLLEFELTSSIKNGLQVIRQATVLQDAGLTEVQMALLNAPINIASVQISATEAPGSASEGKTPEEQAVNMGLVYFIVILLFMAIMITGQLIASEITAEKAPVSWSCLLQVYLHSSKCSVKL